MKVNDVAIIIPAYKETQNILILLKKIFINLPQALVVIVDDSPAKEHKELEEILTKIKRNVLLLTRPHKMGRGSAVLYGFSHVLKDKTIQNFFEIDADLAHNPDELPLFLAKKNEADLIIGSRYLAQSKIVKWPLRRVVMSKIINIFLHFWLGLRLSDYTNGYRMYNRKAVQFLLNQKLRESGFIALSEISYKLKKANFRIIEIPTTFTDRKYGKSNAGFKELMQSLAGAIRIRFS